MNFECSGNMAIESEELSTKKPNQGFSFIEIMIVIVIMAGIIAIVGPTLFSKLDEAKIDQAKIQMKSLSAALDLYHLDNSVFPSTDQGIEALISKPEIGIVPPHWKGPYLRGAKIPKDPWGFDYAYLSDGKSITIKSLGADGEEGGEDSNAVIIFEQ